MIDKAYGEFILVCDICGEEAPYGFAEFYEAVEYKKAFGWKSQKNGNEYDDVCPECQEAAP